MNVTNKKRKTNIEEDWVIVHNTHEQIISREVFEQAKMLLEQKDKRGRGKTIKHLFTNIAYCSECGIEPIEKDTSVKLMLNMGILLVPVM